MQHIFFVKRTILYDGNNATPEGAIHALVSRYGCHTGHTAAVETCSNACGVMNGALQRLYT